MTMFGTNIEINLNKFDKADLMDRLTDSMVARNNERKIFKNFLDAKTVDDITVFEKLLFTSRNEADNLSVNGSVVTELPVVREFIIKELKSQNGYSVNLYEQVVRSLIENLEPSFIKTHKLFDQGKIGLSQSPKGYPGTRKRAEGLFLAKIADGITPDIQTEYLSRVILESRMRSLVREMFGGINKFGLDKEQAAHYLRIIFDISEVQEVEPVNFGGFKRIVAEGLKTGNDVNLAHIKCLRFTYPKSGGVKILTDIVGVVIDGVLGKYKPKSESLLFLRLFKVKEIFESSGLKINFNIIIDDEDLDLLFPPGNNYVSENNLKEAKNDAAIYIEGLKSQFGSNFSFTTVSSLTNGNRTYKSFREGVLRDIKAEGGRYVNPDFFESDRVDHQYEYYQQLFGPTYSRDEARRSILEQTASTIALQEIFRSIGDKDIILIEENRGGENKLIANGSVPVIFTRLRDAAVFDVE